jgi:hypothetical protein
MKKIIGIAGNARSGKDTVGGLLKDIFERHGHKVHVVSFAAALRAELDEFCMDKLGISSWTTDENEKKIIRPFLVCWGTEIRRAVDESYWIKALEISMKNDSADTLYIITDLRFENELKWIQNLGGSTLYLERNSIAPANEYERANNKILKTLVDNVWDMPTTRDMETLKEYTEKICLHAFKNIL